MKNGHDGEDAAVIQAEIARVMAEHQAATGQPALHVRRCTRPDLDAQLLALYVRQRAADARSGS